MNIRKLFNKKSKGPLTDEQIYKVLGTKLYIHNGYSIFGGISDHFLFDNQYIEVGFGRVTSGYGDWGGGFDRASTMPLQVTIDKDFNIIKSKTDSFFNSEASQETEKKAEELLQRLGDKLIVKNPILLNAIKKIFRTIPIKRNLSLDFDVTDEELPVWLQTVRNDKANEIKLERRWKREELEWEKEQEELKQNEIEDIKNKNI